jgi:putative transposase
LGADQNIQKIMPLIKEKSSFWINKNQLTKAKFEWQDEYFAVYVSESLVDKVRDYLEANADKNLEAIQINLEIIK